MKRLLKNQYGGQMYQDPNKYQFGDITKNNMGTLANTAQIGTNAASSAADMTSQVGHGAANIAGSTLGAANTAIQGGGSLLGGLFSFIKAPFELATKGMQAAGRRLDAAKKWRRN